jgi:hypothetical protein
MQLIKQNVGVADRIIRIALSFALGFFVVQSPDFGVQEIVLMVIAGLLFLSATFARCYVWYIFSVSTCGFNHNNKV